MNAFNLNVDAYTPKELERLFGLRPLYTEGEINESYTKLIKQLKKSKDLGLEKQKDILFFLDTVSNKLINNVEKKPSTKGTWSETLTPTEQYGSNIIITNANTIAGKKARTTDGRIAVSGAAPPGYINPINVRTIMQPISIDSRFRPNYYATQSTNFSIMLPFVQKKVISMRVATIEMPMTWYSFTTTFGNTSFLVIADPSGQSWDRKTPDYGGKWSWDYNDLRGNLITTATDAARDNPNYKGFLPVQPAWLVNIPNGNYEVSFLDKNKSMPIDTAINDALSVAIPGAIDIEGRFGYEANPGPADPTTTTGSIGWLNAGVPLGATVDSSLADIRFTVGRGSGRSIFASPGYPSNAVYGGGAMPFVPDGITNPKKIVGLRFNIYPWGDLDMTGSIQTKLGWQIGFRAAQYIMGKGAWDGLTTGGDQPPALRLPDYINNDASGIPISAISEGICMPTGPRYGFLSIDDHCNSHGPHYLVAYSKSTLDDNIITRINLSAEMDKTGVYKDNSDPGISTQVNRTREYFGPVDIQKLEIKVYDEYGRILDLNNMDWSFTLAFEKLYD
jgi:hypothetical protein